MFCSNCGKEIRQGANFCMYCGTPVGDIEKGKETEWTSYEGTTEEENYGDYDYSNCENGIVSFPKMFRKFFSKDLKEYFPFDGTYSRLEYFYARVIVYIALFAIVVPCTAVPEIYKLVVVPLTVACILFLQGEKFKEQNEDASDYGKTNDETEEREEDVEKEKAEKFTVSDFFLIFIFGLIISAIIAVLSKG